MNEKTIELSLKEEFITFLEQFNISQAAAARGVGVSATAINQYVSPTGYPGNVVQLEKKIKEFMRRTVDKREVRTENLVSFSITEAMYQYFDMAQIEAGLVVLTANPGLGKSIACRAYQKENPTTVLIEVDPGYSAPSLLQEICKALGISVSYDMHAMMSDLIDKLKDSGRLLIIDEADGLTFKALETIRRLKDKAGIGLALVGMRQLYANMRGKQGQFAQLHSRVDAYKHFVSITDEDARDYIRANVPDISETVREYLIKKCTLNARVLQKLCKNTMRIARNSDEELSCDHVDLAANALMSL